MSATVSQYPYTIGMLGVEACLAAAAGGSLPAKVDAPIQVVTEAQRGARGGERSPSRSSRSRARSPRSSDG